MLDCGVVVFVTFAFFAKISFFFSFFSFYGAGICRYFLRGQDGRVVKASFFYCEMRMVTRGIETWLQILPSKEVHIVRRDGSITSAILYGAGICRYF